ncbi:MAG: FliO/MopB family protein [Spirochaetales bacterium]|nr:FliO/MopB family protein [Spirochaetales bacterium]
MITKKLFLIVLILNLFITTIIVAQETATVTDLPETNEETSEVEGNREYVSVPEESLIILDTADPGAVENTTALNTFSVWDFVRMLLVLGAVLGFIYFVFFLLKKAGKPKLITDSTINVISTQNLEAGRSLHLIEIGPQIFLIGSGESSVQLISEITNKETLDTIKLDKSTRSESNNTFTDIFRGFFKKENSTISLAKSGQISFMKKQRERLKNM